MEMGHVPPALRASLAGARGMVQMDLRETSRLLRRRVQLIAWVSGAFALLGLLLAMVMTPQYRAEVVLLLDQRRSNLVDMGMPAPSLLNDGGAALRSEMDIIRSRAVLDRVIVKQNLLFDAELKPTDSSWMNPRNWFAEKTREEEAEEQARKKTKIARNIVKRMSVSNDGRSNSIRVTFDSRDPKKAAALANAIADEYLVDQLEAKYDVIARANTWLSERLATLRKQVEISEKAVEDFRQEANLIQIDGATVATRQMDDINSQLTAARGQTSQAEARLRSAQSMVNVQGGVEAAADVLASPLIQKLREQEAEVRRREAELSTRYGDRHPRMINIRAEYKDLQRKIAEEVQKILRALDSEVTIARAKETQLQKDLSSLESKAGGELKDTVQLRQLQREADANRALYENFLARFKQTSAQQDMQLPDTRIIAHADVPDSIAFPKKWLFIVVGGFLGLMAGILGAYVAEYFDRGYRTGPQLEQGTGLSAIGMIPNVASFSKHPPEDYVIEKPLSAFSEALRTVRTAIHFSNVDHPPKTVMVTSSAPNEGKTAFCLSLARSLALAGSKILVIDADLRCSRLGDFLKLDAAKGGLAELLAGEKDFKDVVRHDAKVKNLDLLPSFGRAPNAQDLLGSQHMKAVIEKAAQKYDLVLVDTPPILAVTDAAMVARAVDTSVFLVRWAETSRDTVTQALRQLQNLDCKIAGAVMTQVDLDELAGYGDGYYSYRYHQYYTE